jgi:cell wall assembly regulator SMI1
MIGTPAFDQVGHYDPQLQSEINELWERIEAALKKHGDSYTENFAPPATDEQIAQLESTLGYRLPGDFKASLKVHNGTGKFLSQHELRDVTKMDSQWYEYVEILSGPVTGPLSSDPAQMGTMEWHPAWLPVGGWDVYEIIVSLETGRVLFWTGYEAQEETKSWKRWLEIVAERLESGAYSPENYWADEDDYWTPGSERKM